MPHLYEVRIRKEALKFASSHMTVFPDGSKEALHGHQYQPTILVRFRDASFENMIPFSELKEGMRGIAREWDEKTLIAVKNPFYREISRSESEIEFRLCGKRYVLPSDEVVLLEITNVTCEELARCYFERLSAALRPVFAACPPLSMTVLIEESPGQGASYTHENNC